VWVNGRGDGLHAAQLARGPQLIVPGSIGRMGRAPFRVGVASRFLACGGALLRYRLGRWARFVALSRKVSSPSWLTFPRTDRCGHPTRPAGNPCTTARQLSGCAAYFMLSWARWRDSSVVLLDVSRSHSDRRSGTLTGPWYNTHNLSVIRRIPDDNRVGDRQNVTATKHMKQGPHPS